MLNQCQRARPGVAKPGGGSSNSFDVYDLIRVTPGLEHWPAQANGPPSPMDHGRFRLGGSESCSHPRNKVVPTSRAASNSGVAEATAAARLPGERSSVTDRCRLLATRTNQPLKRHESPRDNRACAAPQGPRPPGLDGRPSGHQAREAQGRTGCRRGLRRTPRATPTAVTWRPRCAGRARNRREIGIALGAPLPFGSPSPSSENTGFQN